MLPPESPSVWQKQADQVIDFFLEKTGAGDGGNTDLTDHPLAEFQIRISYFHWFPPVSSFDVAN